jgi:hypothetical protein
MTPRPKQADKIQGVKVFYGLIHYLSGCFLWYNLFYAVAAVGAKLVIKHKPPALATFWACNIEWLPAVNAILLISTRCFSTFWAIKCTHFCSLD